MILLLLVQPECVCALVAATTFIFSAAETIFNSFCVRRALILAKCHRLVVAATERLTQPRSASRRAPPRTCKNGRCIGRANALFSFIREPLLKLKNNKSAQNVNGQQFIIIWLACCLCFPLRLPSRSTRVRERRPKRGEGNNSIMFDFV